MLQGYNTLQYYESKSLQRWERLDNMIFVYFKTDILPSFILISDTSASSATAQVYNAIDDTPFGATFPVVVSVSGSKKILKIENKQTVGGEDGCYYTKIIAGGDIFYSEVYKWVDDTLVNRKEIGLLEITAVSQAITIGSTYEVDAFTYSCLLKTNNPVVNESIKETGKERTYGDLSVFTTRVIKQKYEMLGGVDAFKFLTGLRVLDTNGTVTFIYDGISYIGIDINFEKTDSISFDDGISMTIEFTEQDYISTRNET